MESLSCDICDGSSRRQHYVPNQGLATTNPLARTSIINISQTIPDYADGQQLAVNDFWPFLRCFSIRKGPQTATTAGFSPSTTIFDCPIHFSTTWHHYRSSTTPLLSSTRIRRR